VATSPEEIIIPTYDFRALLHAQPLVSLPLSDLDDDIWIRFA
jgi:hypothetical protein